MYGAKFLNPLKLKACSSAVCYWQGSHILENPWKSLKKISFVCKALKVFEFGHNWKKNLEKPLNLLLHNFWISFIHVKMWQYRILWEERMARREVRGGCALKISLKIVFVDLKNLWKDLKSSFQRSVGTLIDMCRMCEQLMQWFYIYLHVHPL